MPCHHHRLSIYVYAATEYWQAPDPASPSTTFQCDTTGEDGSCSNGFPIKGIIGHTNVSRTLNSSFAGLNILVVVFQLHRHHTVLFLIYYIYCVVYTRRCKTTCTLTHIRSLVYTFVVPLYPMLPCYNSCLY